MSFDASESGVLSRNPGEIARVLQLLVERRSPVTTRVEDLRVESRLLVADPGGGRIVLERPATEAASRALLARPLCAFHAVLEGKHVEFSAAEPRESGKSIVLRFPEVMMSRPERAHPRAAVTPHAPLRCLADAGGVTPFDARMIDIGRGGVAFLVYPSDITLQPGTLLRGCRIEGPGGRVCTVDLEVRYSQAVRMKDGTSATRSGCRFVDPSPEVLTLVHHYAGE